VGNRPHCFKHRDVVRAVNAARAAGVKVEAITIDTHTGKITLGPAQGGVDGQGQPNAWDEVLNTDAEDAKRPA
jgi:hypothetical protein